MFIYTFTPYLLAGVSRNLGFYLQFYSLLSYLFSLAISLCLGGYTYATVFNLLAGS